METGSVPVGGLGAKWKPIYTKEEVAEIYSYLFNQVAEAWQAESSDEINLLISQQVLSLMGFCL